MKIRIENTMSETKKTGSLDFLLDDPSLCHSFVKILVSIFETHFSDPGRAKKLILPHLLASLPEDEQIAIHERHFRRLSDDKKSGLYGLFLDSRDLSPEARIGVLDADRDRTVTIAATKQAHVDLLQKKLTGSKRPHDPETVRLAEAVRHLRVQVRLSWKKTAERIHAEHADWFPPSANLNNIQKRCEKAYRRVVEGKRD